MKRQPYTDWFNVFGNAGPKKKKEKTWLDLMPKIEDVEVDPNDPNPPREAHFEKKDAQALLKAYEDLESVTSRVERLEEQRAKAKAWGEWLRVAKTHTDRGTKMYAHYREYIAWGPLR